jgi:AGZA family xanthine/uracil permease-like MFS transporter
MNSPAVLLAVFGVFITVALLAVKIKAGVFLGIVATAAVGVIAGAMGVAGMPELPTAIISTEFDTSAVFAFTRGFSDLLSHPQTFLIIFTFLFVDFFDTAGTLVAVANRTNLVDEDGNMENIDKALMADAIGTLAGAALGTSTVTSYIESASGVEVGGRTGLTAVTTAVLFVLAIFFAPLLAVVNGTVTAPALIVVGILMAQQLGGIDWNDFVSASSGFMTVIVMLLAYSISDGIAIGFITYIIASVAAKRAKEIDPIIWVLLPIFILHYVLK